MTTDIAAILRQREELKRRDPEAILLFRVEDELGDMYRAYGDDAAALDVDPILGGVRFVVSHFTTDDRRWIGIAPEDLETLLDRIVQAGKRAAVCEPYWGPKPPGATVERVVTEGRREDGPRHTPGPWIVWEPETEHGSGSEPAKTIVIGKDKPDDVTQEIAYVNCQSFYFDDDDRIPVESGLIREPFWPTAPAEAVANARLIAAAPDMLAALRRFVAWDETPHVSEGDAADLRKAVAAAIAKAEGRKS